jgi:hypothetical protein
MFSYTGLSAAQVDRLREEFGVYLIASGRMCVAGLMPQCAARGAGICCCNVTTHIFSVREEMARSCYKYSSFDMNPRRNAFLSPVPGVGRRAF